MDRTGMFTDLDFDTPSRSTRTSRKKVEQNYNLRKRLKFLCDQSEALAKGEDGEQLKAMVFTHQIRKILAENS